jgi:hypothetical protein
MTYALTTGRAVILALLLTAAPLRAGVETRVVWVAGQPHAEVTIDAQPPAPLKDINLPAELTDAQGTNVWTGVIKVAAMGPRPWQTRFLLPNVKDAKKQHKLRLRLPDQWLDDYLEEIYFAAESAPVQTYGLRARGFFPARKVSLTLGLNGFKSADARDVPVTLRLRDGDDNAVLTRQAAVQPAREPRLHLLDVTPDAAATGPFSLDVNVESEANQLFFNAGLKFAQANARVPTSSMEHGDPALWFAGSPANRPSYQTLQYYYSPHLTDLLRYDTPAIRYDRKHKHSGRQSLRIDYPVNREADVWSLQVLPAKPLAVGLWVRGNGSHDQLVIHFEDNSNFTAPAWQRNANFSSAVIGTLDFTGWRRFRVPVLGEGLQVSGTKGSTEKVDAPVRILALTIKPEPLPKGADANATRSVWLDDLDTETQVQPAEALSMELQLDDVHGRLTPAGTVAVAVGNGLATPCKRGKVMLTARAGDTPLWTRTVDLPVEAETFAVTEVPLKDLADKQPRGPVDLDATFQDVGQPGARITRRVTLKAAAHAGIVHDFEEPITFSGYEPGKVGKSAAQVVAGGAQGSAHSLALPVKPPPEDNSILFHPALPGIPDRVEIMVHGGDRPVTLQPWFIDSAYTGIWLRPYNLFWADPITVDWQGWRQVTIPAPPIPAYHGDKNRYFLFRPWYPLNFAIGAQLVAGETPTEIRLDNLRVVTHLSDDELLKAELEYPDDTHIHPPGAALRLVLTNFAAAPASLPLRYELRSYQGPVSRSGTLDIAVPPGARHKVVLVEALPPGIYDLKVQGIGKTELAAPVLALDARKYFGAQPMDVLINPVLLRWQLGLTTEKTYLDWDNAEPAPYLRHGRWFEEEIKKLHEIKILPKDVQPAAARLEAAVAAVAAGEQAVQKPPRDPKVGDTLKWHLPAARAEVEAATKALEQAKEKYHFTVQPVVGFCAEWAGPEAVETMRKLTYTRWIPNRLQLPRHLIDWSLFVRETQREYKGRFDSWVFWENPDLDDSPQSIPPRTYAPMLEAFARWVKLYSPNARVVAGGFNFPKALDYLQKVPNVAQLSFDELAVQMNLGELAPERADVEGFLDDLNALLRIPERLRTVRLTELDWPIGKYLSPLQQAAYHARAALILDSRGAPPHQLNIMNTGFDFEGYGVCYRVPYGNTAELQTHKPCHIPKPSYFALLESQKFLKEWKYLASVNLSDRSLSDNRAFVYRNAAGALTAAVWRTTDGERIYRVPASWQGAAARDIFGFPASLDAGLRCTLLPTLVLLPVGYRAEQLLFDLRTLEAADGSEPVILDLHLSEADSARRAGHRFTGNVRAVVRGGALLGERKVREPYVEGLESEHVEFDLGQAGNVLLRRRWHFHGDGQRLFVKLNEGPEEAWDQSQGQGNDPGLRETTFVLRHCRSGKNQVAIRYDKPGNCAGYRLEPMPADHLPLVRAGMLNSRQTKGEAVKHTSSVGTPLAFGKTPCGDGIGAHATSFIEYPLAGQFMAFEVTVGIDGSTEGRGSVVFHVYVDGKERVSSGPMNGFSKPKTLRVDGLEGARRLILTVTDGEDGNRDDLANWVDGKLYLKDQ